MQPSGTVPDKHTKFSQIWSVSDDVALEPIERERNDQSQTEPECNISLETIVRRTKQIEFGKRTEGYQNYIRSIPRDQRSEDHPQTPNKYYEKCSRRNWDDLIKKWRRRLHEYDALGGENCSNLENTTIISDRSTDLEDASSTSACFVTATPINRRRSHLRLPPSATLDGCIMEGLFVTETERSTRCPITLQVMTQPVRNKHCGHTYDRAGASMLILTRQSRARCPVAGCTNNRILFMTDLEEDKELLQYMRSDLRTPGRRRSQQLSLQPGAGAWNPPAAQLTIMEMSPNNTPLSQTPQAGGLATSTPRTARRSIRLAGLAAEGSSNHGTPILSVTPQSAGQVSGPISMDLDISATPKSALKIYSIPKSVLKETNVVQNSSFKVPLFTSIRKSPRLIKKAARRLPIPVAFSDFSTSAENEENFKNAKTPKKAPFKKVSLLDSPASNTRSRGLFAGETIPTAKENTGLPLATVLKDRDLQCSMLLVEDIPVTVTRTAVSGYFQTWGKVEWVNLKLAQYTMKKVQAMYIKFSNPTSVNSIQTNRPHKIGNETVKTRRVLPRQLMETICTRCQVYVEGFPPATSEDQVRQYFSSHGRLTDLVYGQAKDRKVSCAILVFEDYDKADQLVQKWNIRFKRKKCDICRPASGSFENCLKYQLEKRCGRKRKLSEAEILSPRRTSPRKRLSSFEYGRHAKSLSSPPRRRQRCASPGSGINSRDGHWY